MKEQTDKTEIAIIATEMKNLTKSFDDFKREIRKEIQSLKNSYVTKAEFQPVKNIAYGLVGTILLSVAGALLALVFK